MNNNTGGSTVIEIQIDRDGWKYAKLLLASYGFEGGTEKGWVFSLHSRLKFYAHANGLTTGKKPFGNSSNIDSSLVHEVDYRENGGQAFKRISISLREKFYIF